MLGYDPPWRRTGLADALAAARTDEVRRQVCLVGPHRDDLDVVLDGLPARTHASQGEQRTLALALRLAGHRVVTDRIGSAPVLLLDDVLLRARSRPQRRAPAAPPAGAGAPDHGRAPARRGRARHACCASSGASWSG